MSCDDRRYSRLSALDLRRTLAQRLVPVADRLRDLRVRFGLRPYRVSIVRTRWTGGERGVGAEVVMSTMEILPVPLISDLDALTAIVQPVGLDEVGGVLLSEVSGAYTEEQLRGLDPDGAPPQDDDQVFWEVEFLDPGGGSSERRRFFMRSAPTYAPARFSWQVRLEKSHEDRARDGEPR